MNEHPASRFDELELEDDARIFAAERYPKPGVSPGVRWWVVFAVVVVVVAVFAVTWVMVR